MIFDRLLQIIYWGLPALTLALSLIILAILILSKKDHNIKSFMLTVISMSVWSLASLMMKLSISPGTLFWNRVMVAGLMMIPLSAYFFFIGFIKRKRTISLIFWTTMTFIMQIINALGYTTIKAEMISLPHGPYIELVYDIGIGAYFSYVLIFGLLLVCLALARNEVKQSKLVSMGLKYVVTALFVIFIGIGANLVPVIGKYPVDFFMGSVATILIMRAIYRNRILELKFVITKALIFTLLLTFITIGSIITLNGLISVFSQLNTGLDNNVFILLVTFVSLVIFQPIFKFLYSLVNDFFYKEENRRTDLINGFTMKIANTLDLNYISQELMDAVTEISSNKRNYLFLKDDDKNAFSFTLASQKLDRVNFKIAKNHSFIQWFEQSSDLIYGKDLETHPFFKAMWSKDIGLLNEILFEVAIPLKTNNKLIGFILLCHKDVRSINEIKHLEQVSMVCITASLAIMNALMYDKAKVEAATDSLTNTFNHRYFMDQLTSSTLACKQTMALAMIGIDMFTVYNDIYGSYSGDSALITVANRIKQVCGNQAIVSRYGGDIFALIIPNLDTKLAYDLCEKIRVQIEKNTVGTEEEPTRNITVSCGLCVYPSMANNDKNLLKNAGLAMVSAKHSGRNKTVIFNNMIADNPDITASFDENQWATIYALTATIDAKDHFTFGHSQRVAKYATAIAGAMGASASDIELIRQASLLHDIGKIGIAEAVLTKTTRLTQDEYDTMKRHVDLSVTIIKYLPSFNKVIPSVIGHHERFDGTGYPRQLIGENIPFGARCIAIADAFDAITSDRHYKANMTVEFALQELLKNSGTQFDPQMAKTFIHLINDGLLIVEPSRHSNGFEQPLPDKLS